jgi:hypothetical protein
VLFYAATIPVKKPAFRGFFAFITHQVQFSVALSLRRHSLTSCG